MNDQDLVQAYIKGDPSAIEILINRHRAKVYTYILLTIKNQPLAEDLFQETFIKVIQSLRSGKYRDLSLRELDGGGWSRLKVSLDRWAADHGAQGYLSLFYSLYENEVAGPPSCAMGAEAVVVDCDGSVYPCFHRKDLLCGNLVSDDPGVVFGRLGKKSAFTSSAPCYGEHCLSLFFGRV